MGESKGETVAWGELLPGPQFPYTRIWGSAVEGTAEPHAPIHSQGAPHQSNGVSEPA